MTSLTPSNCACSSHLGNPPNSQQSQNVLGASEKPAAGESFLHQPLMSCGEFCFVGGEYKNLAEDRTVTFPTLDAGTLLYSSLKRSKPISFGEAAATECHVSTHAEVWPWTRSLHNTADIPATLERIISLLHLDQSKEADSRCLWSLSLSSAVTQLIKLLLLHTLWACGDN